MSAIILEVPDPPTPPATLPVCGPWVDASSLGKNPLAQITQAASAGDLVRLETSATPANTTATARKNWAIDLGGADTTPATLTIPLAQVRAVRLGGSTPGLTVTLAPTNSGGPPGTAGAPGAPGAPGAALIWQPGGPGGGGANVFTDWTALNAGAALGTKVLVDLAYNPNPTIPAGPWVNIYEVAGYLPSSEPLFNAFSASTVNVADGATFPSLSVVSDYIALNFIAMTTIPIVRGDGQTITVRNGGLIQNDPSATLPAIQLTPGNSGGPNYPYFGPAIVVDDYSQLGGGNGDVVVAPLVAAPNVVILYLRNSGVADGSVVSGGPFAADSSVSLNYFDAESVYDSVLFTAPSIGTLITNTLGAGLPQYQFGAATSGTSGAGPLVAWIPIGNNPALTTGTPEAQACAAANVQGILTRLSVELLGSGVGPADDTLVELCYTDTWGGPLTPVPGASFIVDTTYPGTSGGSVAFSTGYPNGRLFGIRMTTQNPVTAPFTQIVGFLQ